MKDNTDLLSSIIYYTFHTWLFLLEGIRSTYTFVTYEEKYIKNWWYYSLYCGFVLSYSNTAWAGNNTVYCSKAFQYVIHNHYLVKQRRPFAFKHTLLWAAVHCKLFIQSCPEREKRNLWMLSHHFKRWTVQCCYTLTLSSPFYLTWL